MPWGLLLNVGLKLLGFIIGKNTESKAAKEAWLNFIDTMEHLGLASVNLNQKDRAQRDELRARRDKIN